MYLTQPEMDAMRRSVEAGAALLDETNPGWFVLVDTDKLSVDNPCLCVLGQVYGPEVEVLATRAGGVTFKDTGYSLGLKRLELADLDKEDAFITMEDVQGSLDHGFCFVSERPVYDGDVASEGYKFLDELWTEAVQVRMEGLVLPSEREAVEEVVLSCA